MDKKTDMSILVETFFNTESAPVLSLNIAQGLMENGVDVCAIVTENIENLTDWKQSFPQESLYIWKSYKYKYFEIIKNGIRIKKQISSKRFNYVLYPFPFYRDYLVGRFIKYDENIVIQHDPIPHSGARKRTKKKRLFSTKKDNIVVMSKIFIPIVEENFHISKDHIFYLRHGLMKYPEFKGEFSKEELNGKINFLNFGRIEKYKGLLVLSKAFGELQKQYPDIQLTIAGSGDFSEYKEEYAALNNVTIMNKYITDDEIAYLFSKPNTVVVLPYLDATQSGVVGMAYNYGTPIIVSDTGGMKEQLFDGEVGVYVAPGDVDDLQKKMEQFITDSKIFEKQKLLMQESKEKMSWTYITKEFLDQIYNHK